MVHELVGQTLGRKYQVQEFIGGGGMADVFKGYDADLRRSVAIKVPKPERSSDPAFIAAFLDEAVTAANLSHSNIVVIYDVHKEGEPKCIVMEYVAGQDLRQLLRTRGRLTPKAASRLFDQVADALNYAHRRGFVHCDVKPANILIAAGGQAKLTDFGIARAVAHAQEVSDRKRLVGTPRYMSPEHVRRQPLDRRSDIYSLGVVLFEMLTGRVPFDKGSSSTVAKAHLREPPPLPSSINPQLPPALDRVILRALDKDPNRRYQSALEMAAELREASRQQRRDRSTNLGPVLAGALGLVVVAVAFGSRMLQGGPSPTPTSPPATIVPTSAVTETGPTQVGETVYPTATATGPGAATSTLVPTAVRVTETAVPRPVALTATPVVQSTLQPTDTLLIVAPTSPPPTSPPAATSVPPTREAPTNTSVPPTNTSVPPTTAPTREPSPTREAPTVEPSPTR